MGWSEGSRYYYASLFFSKKIYQLDLPYPLPSPSRYLMLSLPFLIPGQEFSSTCLAGLLMDRHDRAVCGCAGQTLEAR
jgi:hypothetical protein